MVLPTQEALCVCVRVHAVLPYVVVLQLTAAHILDRLLCIIHMKRRDIRTGKSTVGKQDSEEEDRSMTVLATFNIIAEMIKTEDRQASLLYI